MEDATGSNLCRRLSSGPLSIAERPVARLRASNLTLDLVQCADAGDSRRAVSDLGVTHFCIEVADIEKEYERLLSAGVCFHCRPIDFFGRAIATYARDPDGNAIELLQLS